MTESFTRRLCLTVDVQGYGRRNDRKQTETQGELGELMDRAARAAGLDRVRWEKLPTGDGEISLIPPSEPEARVIDRFMVELAGLLFRRNCEFPQHERLRLRLAVDHGPVEATSVGYSGTALVAVSRMVDSAVSRAALDASAEAGLVVLLSQRIYTDLVAGGRTELKPERFLQVEVSVKEFSENAWLWVPGVDVEVLRGALARSGGRVGSDGRHRSFPGPSPVSIEVHRLKDLLPERYEVNADLRHTLEIFLQMVSLADARTPLAAYADVGQIALAYVLAELSVIHGHRDAMSLDAEFRTAGRTKRDMESLAEFVKGVEVSDFDTLRRLIDNVSLVEPARIKRVNGLRQANAAACFSYLWGLAHLAQLLDNPCLVDPEMPSSLLDRCSVMAVRDDSDNGGLLVDLATTERTGFHLAAEANHTVRRYFAEMEDAWRRSEMIAPSVRFDLQTPNWAGRSLQVHEIRVDSRPITRLLMGPALYGDRPHVWLRELIMNAMDATQTAGHGRPGYVPRVEVEFEDSHHVVIRDNGVGMTHQQVLTQLCVLGRSGWRDSVAGEEQSDAASFFGRFGIGFASVFSVASTVEINTRTADTSVADGIAVRFSGADRPFFTEFTSCPVGTSIRVTLIHALDAKEFRKALSDLFAFLPASVTVTPDLRIPGALAEYSALAHDREGCKGWSIFERSWKARLGPYGVSCKLEVLHDPKPHKRSGQPTDSPLFHRIGRTSLTFCAGGVRITAQHGLKGAPRVKETNNFYEEQARNLWLSGCYLTVDFGRDDAPLMASRNELNFDEELQRELEKLLRRELAALLPELVAAVQATCISDRDRHDAGYQTLARLLSPSSSQGSTGRPLAFHESSALAEAAAAIYAGSCPVLVEGAEGKRRYSLLADVDPNACSVATMEALTGNTVFPAFVRATELEEWIVVGSARELALLELAWPHDVSLRILDEKAQLYEDFQMILPEAREGRLWSLLRADYALADGAVFGSGLYLQLPGRKGFVSREEGLLRRRCDAAMTERPRIVLNRKHEIIRTLEEHLDKAGSGTKPVQEWLDRLCKDVLDEKSQRVANVVLAKLREQLAEITGVHVSHMSLADLRVS